APTSSLCAYATLFRSRFGVTGLVGRVVIDRVQAVVGVGARRRDQHARALDEAAAVDLVEGLVDAGGDAARGRVGRAERDGDVVELGRAHGSAGVTRAC